MWKGGLLAGLLGLFASHVSAVYIDEANVIDWHHEQIGIVSDVITAQLPTLGVPSILETLFGVYTESNVLAVLNASDESLVWRRQFSGTIKSHTLTSLGDSAMEVLLSITQETNGAVHSRVFQWDLSDGALVWELALEGEVTGITYDEGVGYLATGNTVHSIDLKTGTIVWSAKSNEEASFVGFIKNAELLAIAELDQGLTIQSLNLDGTKFGSAIVAGAGELLHASNNVIAWKEGKHVKIAKIDESGAILDSISEEGDSVVINKKVAIVSGAKNVVFDLETLGELHVLEAASVGLVAGNDEVFVRVDAQGTFSEIEAVTGEVLGKFSLQVGGQPSIIAGKRLGMLVQHRNGVLQLVDPTNKNVVWKRDESLAETVGALILDLPDVNEGSLDVEELWYEEHSNILSAFFRRVQRHVSDLHYLPHMLRELAYSIVLTDSPELQFSRANTFGLRKFFVSVSKTGRVVALDTFLSGAPVWEIDSVAVNGAKVASIDTTVYILTEDGILTVIDGLLGMVTETKNLGLQNVEEIVEIYTGEEKSLLVWTSDEKMVLLAGPEVGSYYTTKTNSNSITGYTYANGVFTKTWEFNAPEDSVIAATAKRDPQDVTVSVANVLGDRTVLYKYLHKNILAVATTSASSQSVYVFILDTVTGRILHSKKHEDVVDVSQGVHIVYGEHWLVYSFWSQQPTMGEKVVVWDLYESDSPNVRLSNASYSSFDDFPLPHVKAQSFFAPVHFTGMGLSRTRFGITVRDVIASTATNQVITIAKRVLDPRRPVKRKPTSDEASEGLFTYHSFLNVDSQQHVLSHSRYVLGANQLATAPARLESTSVVVAHGFDVFCTRVTPSRQFDVLNSSFAKNKLVYTIGALITLVAYFRPYVARRAVNMKWGVE